MCPLFICCDHQTNGSSNVLIGDKFYIIIRKNYEKLALWPHYKF